jgi:Complex1_LYR-like
MSHAQNVRTLYKSILRLQRGLPTEIQEVGTKYVKDEFKRHKNLKFPQDEVLIKTFMW